MLNLWHIGHRKKKKKKTDLGVDTKITKYILS